MFVEMNRLCDGIVMVFFGLIFDGSRFVRIGVVGLVML